MAAALTLYSNPFSQPCRAVRCFLALNHIDYELHPIDFGKGDHRSPEFLAINPQGLIPVITHGDFTLSESGAILIYLAEAFHVENQWYPADIHQRAQINSYLHWHHTNSRKHVYGYVFHKVTQPVFMGLPPIAPEKEAELKANVDTFMAGINQTLEAHHYIARTSQASLADLQCFCELAQLKLANYDFTPYPAVKRWFEELESNPQINEIHQPLFGFARKLNTPAEEATN
ncbi:unnamed protein product [Blepharisma stoltei]|uniref:Glutathione S-transferase n=1 Tax=Blepharisma stoltei TaxID=1481888 RepID=A0AAU9I933_9CILI|nr:unnamed protein product [Blepharisma stoltei]